MTTKKCKLIQIVKSPKDGAYSISIARDGFKVDREQQIPQSNGYYYCPLNEDEKKEMSQIDLLIETVIAQKEREIENLFILKSAVSNGKKGVIK